MNWTEENVALRGQTIVDQTEREHRETGELWEEGIESLLRGLDPLQEGQGVVLLPLTLVMAELLVHAINSLLCAYDLATRGYYSQSINLVRMAQEVCVALLYVQNFPEKHSRFTDPTEKTPEFNEMLTAIEGKHKLKPLEAIRRWRQDLNRFPHVDRWGLQLLTDVEGPVTRVRLGPYYDGHQFIRAAADSLAALVVLSDAVDDMRVVIGHEKLDRGAAFRTRLLNWEAEETKRFRRDVEYFDQHRRELIVQYPDRWVAVYEGRVVGAAKDIKRLAKQLEGKGIPRGRAFVDYTTERDEPLIL